MGWHRGGDHGGVLEDDVRTKGAVRVGKRGGQGRGIMIDGGLLRVLLGVGVLGRGPWMSLKGDSGGHWP
jgi:hypothetical protein